MTEATDHVGHDRVGYVALVGRPNAGKSTLLNRLVGTKVAIVSDKPQTTRNRITGIVTRDSAQIVFVDTPGIHRPLHRMNERMMAITRDALSTVDVVCAMVDVTEEFGGGDAYMVEMLSAVTAPRFLLLNKIDRIKKVALLPLLEAWSKRLEWTALHPISAHTGDGLERLEQNLIGYLPEGTKLYPDDQASEITDRFLASEIVREKILQLTHNEVPYATTVVLDAYEEPADIRQPIRVLATILVEGTGQKAILIGRAGQFVKTIGIAARLELESLLERKVYLELKVRKSPKWRENDTVLEQISLPRK